jgi:hypothetical protein
MESNKYRGNLSLIISEAGLLWLKFACPTAIIQKTNSIIIKPGQRNDLNRPF